MNVINPATHEHREELQAGRRVCKDCGQILVTPILSHDDQRLKDMAKAAEDERRSHIIGGLLWAHRNGAPADFFLMILTERLGIERPNYIDQIDQVEWPTGLPPHVQTGEWWND